MSDRAEPPPAGEPADGFERILASTENRELSELYDRKDAAAVAERARMFFMLRWINRLVLAVALLSGLILAQASFSAASAWMGLSKEQLGQIVTGLTILVGLAAALPSWRSLAGTAWLGEAGGMMPELRTYRGFRFPAEIISHAVWLYHVFSLSLRDVELILAERGVDRRGILTP